MFYPMGFKLFLLMGIPKENFMLEIRKIAIEKPEGHHCFACGTANPKGLNLQFYREGNTVSAEITLERSYEGWENVAHGGIVSTLVDEVMSWATMCDRKDLYVTRKMNIKYVRPVKIGVPLKVKGMVSGSSKPPIVQAKAEIRDLEGRLLVRGSGEFVKVTGETLDSVPANMKEEMLSLFEQMD